MPLPTAPTQRASFLNTQDYGLPAKESVKPMAKASSKKPRMDDFEGGMLGGKALPVTKMQAQPEIFEKSAERHSLKAVARYAHNSNSSPSALTQAPLGAAPAPMVQFAMPVADVQTAQPARAPQAAPQALAQTKPANATTAKAKKTKSTGPAKLFVLDTNVLMHDPMSLFRFEEHDIYLPMIVLEELDGHKKGMTEVARNARQVSRTLDALAAVQGADMAHGLKLDATGHRGVHGRLFFQTQPLNYTLPISLPQGKADNQILGVVGALGEMHKAREVVLVSKDINMRVKARALGLPTDDYQNDKTLEDGDLLYTGSMALPNNFWDTHGKGVESWQQNSVTFYRISGPVVPNLLINQFVFLESPGEPPLYARVSEIRGKTAVLRTLKDHNHNKNAVWGVTTRNREQNFAMNLLMDPDVDLVTLAGTAGSGKTLMALAAGLTQVLDDRRYTEIIMTRATVSVGEDIGFLPGTEE